MKKSIILFFLLLTIPSDAQARTYNPLVFETKEVKTNNCFMNSNHIYNMCMMSCISPMSPREIMDLCWKKCARIANQKFFECVMEG